jgi:L-threonylcarbamoyladenylate synthase
MTDTLARAATVLRAGGVVLHPTEAVWGLAADAHDAEAVARVYALKQRPVGKGLIVIAATFETLRPLLASVPDDRMRAALATWPGPHTWVFPASSGCPTWLAGDRGTIAVRISAHRLTRSLCEVYGCALVSTSANRSGDPPPRSLAEVDGCVREGVALELDGDTDGLGRPTPVRDVLTGDFFRD